MLRKHSALLLALLLALLFAIGTAGTAWRPERAGTPEGQVVIPAPVQLLIFAGDRYLAANMEAIRAATITLDDLNNHQRATYRLRSHQVVARLNPCHEDNYYFANATLTWGGLEKAGNNVLRRAMECRFWDFIPAFYYGFNQYFFYHDIEKAYAALQIAAQRTTQNKAPLLKLAIMIKAESLEDESMAINYLRGELQNTDDPKLSQMLEKRLKRLQGLVVLRNAQREYEKKYEQRLRHPDELIEKGILSVFPEDPLKLGYKFSNGKFQLNSMKIRGMEKYQ